MKKLWLLLFVLAAFSCISSNAYAQIDEKTYKYLGTDRVDPFRPMTLSLTPTEISNTLQLYDLRELKLVGTLLGIEMSALIMTPGSQGIIARIGDKIGKKNGRIVIIDKNQIIIRQAKLSNLENSGTTKLKKTKYEDITMLLNTNDAIGDSIINTGSLGGLKYDQQKENNFHLDSGTKGQNKNMISSKIGGSIGKNLGASSNLKNMPQVLSPGNAVINNQ